MHFELDGFDLMSLVQKYGSPLYVFSKKRILENIAELKDTLVKSYGNTKFFYASKANSNPEILKIICQSGINIEVNSGGELKLALESGFLPEQIIFNGVAKLKAELTETIKLGIYGINVDSFYELEKIISLAKTLGKKAGIIFRVIPEVKTETHHGLQTGTSAGKFGLSFADVLSALGIIDKRFIDFKGLQSHIGSQITDEFLYRQEFFTLLFYALKINKTFPDKQVSLLDLGGGFPIPYLKDEQTFHPKEERVYRQLKGNFSFNKLASQTVKLLNCPELLYENLVTETKQRQEELFFSQDDVEKLVRNLEIIFEPGRKIVGNSGLLLTTIENYKPSWLIIDAGFNVLLDNALYKWYYHLVSVNKYSLPCDTEYLVGGPLCDGGDVFVDTEGHCLLPEKRLLPHGLTAGDVLAFLDTGAYTLEQMTNYNRRPLPSVVLLEETADRLIILT